MSVDDPDSIVVSPMRQSPGRVLTCMLFTVIGLTLVALGAQMGVMLMGVLPVKYISSMRMAGWGIFGVGIILSLVVVVLHRGKRHRQSSLFLIAPPVCTARSRLLMVIAAIIAGILGCVYASWVYWLCFFR